MARPRDQELLREVACPYEACTAHGRLGGENVIAHGRTSGGKQRFRCKTCGKTFTGDHGQLGHRLRVDIGTAVLAVSRVAGGETVRGVARELGVRPETVRGWHRRFGGKHAGLIMLFLDWKERQRLHERVARLRGEDPYAHIRESRTGSRSDEARLRKDEAFQHLEEVIDEFGLESPEANEAMQQAIEAAKDFEEATLTPRVVSDPVATPPVTLDDEAVARLKAELGLDPH